jgi:hypothetical protein
VVEVVAAAVISGSSVMTVMALSSPPQAAVLTASASRSMVEVKQVSLLPRVLRTIDAPPDSFHLE